MNTYYKKIFSLPVFSFIFILFLFLGKSCRYDFRDWARAIFYEAELT